MPKLKYAKNIPDSNHKKKQNTPKRHVIHLVTTHLQKTNSDHGSPQHCFRSRLLFELGRLLKEFADIVLDLTTLPTRGTFSSNDQRPKMMKCHGRPSAMDRNEFNNVLGSMMYSMCYFCYLIAVLQKTVVDGILTWPPKL